MHQYRAGINRLQQACRPVIEQLERRLHLDASLADPDCDESEAIAPPVNDDRRAAIAIGREDRTDDLEDDEDLPEWCISGTTAGATAERNEPAHAGSKAANSVWYAWTAPESGFFSLSILGTRFAVYELRGTRLVPVAASDPESSEPNEPAFAVTGKTRYLIAVDAEDTEFDITLSAIAPELGISGTDYAAIGESMEFSACPLDEGPWDDTGLTYRWTVSRVDDEGNEVRLRSGEGDSFVFNPSQPGDYLVRVTAGGGQAEYWAYAEPVDEQPLPPEPEAVLPPEEKSPGAEDSSAVTGRIMYHDMHPFIILVQLDPVTAPDTVDPGTATDLDLLGDVRPLRASDVRFADNETFVYAGLATGIPQIVTHTTAIEPGLLMHANAPQFAGPLPLAQPTPATRTSALLPAASRVTRPIAGSHSRPKVQTQRKHVATVPSARKAAPFANQPLQPIDTGGANPVRDLPLADEDRLPLHQHDDRLHLQPDVSPGFLLN